MMMIETERLILRPLHLDDADMIESLASEYEVAKTTLTIPHPYPKGAAEDFIKSVLESEKTGRILIYAMIEKETEQFLGIMNVSIQSQYKRGELAYWVGKPFWGKGYGTEAAKALLTYCFEKLELNKVFAAAFTDNPGSWRVMEKIGLSYEGTLKQHVARDGEFKDLCYYGILKENFYK
ncbi:GNAT family N-acetyltransferase [Pseudoneobacillus sp. C159]